MDDLRVFSVIHSMHSAFALMRRSLVAVGCVLFLLLPSRPGSNKDSSHQAWLEKGQILENPISHLMDG
ncbi:hypothetical protein HPP92_004175 [Vanilla planifolia]|uniref:Uncharacterized protein n=1 Tax=Vanilla planifolia TaxID=51239 RepID=A0A835S7K9_VANPL|nr:hypothetical protein HPP92_004616 [Vanilla planifolia]KAG0504103.1 hypothetical protein HPP92_004175 [Vanilla planifolia]